MRPTSTTKPRSVVVIGKRASNITEAQVPQSHLRRHAGNDVSERAWQKQDMQWFRAKASDTFGPMGPSLVTGLDYNNLNLIGRHNGKVVQETNTEAADLLDPQHRQLHQPIRHARAWRRDLHRHAGRRRRR